MKPENHGFIYLHRQIRKHPYWNDAERLRAWIDILLMAAWKDHKRMIGVNQVEVKRGEFIASIRFLAKRWRWSNGKVERYLKAAQDMNEIRVVNETSYGYRYLVVNYDSYQNQRDTYGDTIEYSNGTPSGTATGQREESKEGLIKKNKELQPLGVVSERVNLVLSHAEAQSTKAERRSEFARLVFTYWAARLGKDPKRTKWDEKRRSRLTARLKENNDDICELLCVVDGAINDDFHAGRNDRERPFQQIQTIFKDREMVEKLSVLSPHYGKDIHPFMVAP